MDVNSHEENRKTIDLTLPANSGAGQEGRIKST